MKTIIILFMLTLFSCGNYSEVKTPTEKGRFFAETELSFQLVKSQVFVPHCISCHSAYGSYQTVRDDVGRILSSIEAGRMPKNQGRLSQNLIKLVSDWRDAGSPENADGTSGEATILRPEWASIKEKILAPKCLVCHNPQGQALFLDLSTRQVIFDARNRNLEGSKLIDLESPEESYLLQVIQDPVEPMPPLSTRIPQLNEKEISILTEWISKGLP